ncbi:MAG TPA: DedA family protein [Candidatus Paceibacterota bacterium]|jgi:membrane protein DedA with SNARE-associated domain|nr:DedA family protein [Candidatus Paceibacterota bacterium]
MSGLPFLAGLVAFLEATKYPLFFAGSYIEGTVVMLTGGVLLKLGEVQFVPLYVALILGDVLSDIMWYWIGYFGARPFMMRWGYIINATPQVIQKLERRFKEYHLRILVISKMTMGFGLAVPVLVTAGMLRVSFLRYCIINILGSFVWVAFIIYIGYNFGNVLQLFPEKYQIGSFFVLIAAFFFGLRYLSRKLANVDW